MSQTPNDSLACELFEELCEIPTVDAHEHLQSEADRLGQGDFCSLFQHYCPGDLRAAGATDADLTFMGDHKQPLDQRWQRFKPFFEAIRTGGYARAAMIVIQDILGFDDLTDDTYQPIGEALRAHRTEGLYDRILRDRCNIVACIDCWELETTGLPDYFYHLATGPLAINLHNKSALQGLEARCDHSIHSIDDALDCMTMLTEQWADNDKAVGIKIGHAYQRSLGFAKVDRATAEHLFNRILTHEGNALSFHEALPLQDYLMYQLAARAEALGLPIVIHTGLQAGNYNRIANANPLLLQSLIEEFPKAKFDLFHGGMPWVREIAVLAKYFPGVHLNMAWMHIINPAQARSALSEWLDMVPNTKIFGFGGDFGIVEKVYGHLKLARQNIAAVLAEKVREGAFSRSVASQVARNLMYENPKRFYELPLE